MKNRVEHYKKRHTLLYVDPYCIAPVKNWINHGTAVTMNLIGVCLASIPPNEDQLAPPLVSMLLYLVGQLMTGLLVW